MFERKEYKAKAREQLKGRWLLPFFIVTGITIVTVIIGIVPEVTLTGFQYTLYTYLSSPVVFITSGTLTIALTYFFIAFSKDTNTDFHTFLEGFGLWIKGTLSFLWILLWIFLWSMLFLIPGFVKMYAYSQIFYIIAENPHIGVRRALRMSIEITKGSKGDLLFLDLSFAPWFLLASVSTIVFAVFLPFHIIGVGLIISAIFYNAIMPYYYVSHIYAYQALKMAAIDRKALTPEDFGETSTTTANN